MKLRLFTNIPILSTLLIISIGASTSPLMADTTTLNSSSGTTGYDYNSAPSFGPSDGEAPVAPAPAPAAPATTQPPVLTQNSVVQQDQNTYNTCINNGGSNCGINPSAPAQKSATGSASSASSAATGNMTAGCKESYTAFKNSCERATGAVGATMTGTQGLTSVLSMGSQSPQAACEAMKTQLGAAAGTAIMGTTSCMSIASACANNCILPSNDPAGAAAIQADASAAAECKAQGAQIRNAGLMTSVMTAAGMFTMADCDSLLGDCTDSSASNNPSCLAQYCPTHSTDPTCIAYDQANCSTNPTSTMCAGFTNTTTGLTNPADGLQYANEGNGAFNGYTPTATNPAANSGDGSGSGSGAFGAAPAYSGNAQNAQAGQGNGYNTGVDHGLNGGSGYSTSGVGFTGNGGGPGAGGNPSDLDLKGLLQGLDPSRLPAGANPLAAQGVTGPNDLSNWEKITRMMNRKKVLLKPAEG